MPVVYLIFKILNSSEILNITIQLKIIHQFVREIELSLFASIRKDNIIIRNACVCLDADEC